MSDIAERLQSGEPCRGGPDECTFKEARSGCLCAEAADTITALTARVKELEGAVDKMQRSRDRYRREWEAEKTRAALSASQPAPDATARRSEQRTTCEDCGNSNLAHHRAVWTDDGASYCPTCRKPAPQKEGE